jgi:hypothetical protein
MHYMLRITSYGVAMHLGYVPNYPASHGCIRMQNGFAQRMYRWAHVGVPVSIIGSPPGRVSRSRFSSSYSTRRSRSRVQSPNDILAEFMGRSVAKRATRHSIRSRARSSRKRSRRTKRRQRHGDPLNAVALR